MVLLFTIYKKRHSFECQHSIALAYRIGEYFSNTYWDGS